MDDGVVTRMLADLGMDELSYRARGPTARSRTSTS